MKNRDYKNFAPNNFYHVFNRGNGKQTVFLDDDDRKFFLSRLKENLFPKPPEDRLLGSARIVTQAHTPYIRKVLPPNSFSLISYCLMPNHFHLLIKQNGALPVSKLISKVLTGYSKYFNLKYDKVGHVFQDKFKAILIESDSQLMWLSAYIHQNPKVAGLVEFLESYHWSSYRDYIGIRNGTLCDKSLLLGMFKSSHAYRDFIEDSFEKIKIKKDIEHLLLD